MAIQERQREIYEYLKKHKFATVEQLAEHFFVGPASIRRDLKRLAEQNAIHRTHGGAVFLESGDREIPLVVRERERTGVKEQIGCFAASLVQEGDIIFLDSSTTALAMVPYLRERTITVLTNSIKVCTALDDAPGVRVYLCGGRLRKGEQSTVGPLAIQNMEEFRVKLAFFSCRAMSKDGFLWDYSEDEATLRRAVMRQAQTSCFLCDSTKIGAMSFHRICSCREIDCLLTEQAPDSEVVQLLLESGVELLIAQQSCMYDPPFSK